MQADQHHEILVGGMQPLTMIDFPGRLASVIFTQGCNLRCRFCYNRSLLSAKGAEMLSWQYIKGFLKDRMGFIEAVVFSGGEPCLQPGLLNALREVKEMGFEIALHTNGCFPETVEKALQERLLQFVAVDFKAPFAKYQEITGSAIDQAAYTRVAKMLVEAGISHEYRTTVHPGLLTDSEIISMADWLVEQKISCYAIQQFKHGEALDAALPRVSGPCLQSATLTRLKSRFTSFILRSDHSEKEAVKLKAAA